MLLSPRVRYIAQLEKIIEGYKAREKAGGLLAPPMGIRAPQTPADKGRDDDDDDDDDKPTPAAAATPASVSATASETPVTAGGETTASAESREAAEKGMAVV